VAAKESMPGRVAPTSALVPRSSNCAASLFCCDEAYLPGSQVLVTLQILVTYNGCWVPGAWTLGTTARSFARRRTAPRSDLAGQPDPGRVAAPSMAAVADDVSLPSTGSWSLSIRAGSRAVVDTSASRPQVPHYLQTTLLNWQMPYSFH
jgi:hypothetical protein